MTPDEIRRAKSPEMLPGEIWTDIPGYEGLYQVSSLGRVKSLPRSIPHPRHKNPIRIKGGILKQSVASNGYLMVGLCANGKAVSRTVHSLVMEAFVGPRPKGAEINHKSKAGNKWDNRLCNLEYCTKQENILHAIRALGNDPAERNQVKGSAHPQAKLCEDDVRAIRVDLSQGKSYGEIARRFHVDPSLIGLINRGKIWKHVA